MAASVAYPSWLLMMLVFSGSPLNMPLSLPPLPEDPVLSHVAPEQCVWYMSLAGMDKASATSKNQAEQLLAEADVQNFIRVLTATVKNAITSGLQGETPKDGYEEVPKLLETLLTRPLCIYLGAITPGPHGPTVRGGMVVNLGDKAADFEAGLKKLLDLIPSNFHDGPKPSAAADTTDGWHTLTLPQDIPVVLWAVKEKYLVVGFGEGEAQAIWARSQKSTPQWLTDVRSQLKVERPSMIQYVNLQVLEGMAQMALTVIEGPDRATDTLETLGLTNAKYFASVSGLDQKDIASHVMISTDGPPRGLLSLLDGKPLDADALKSIPADSTFAIAAKVEPVKILDSFIDVVVMCVPPEQLVGQQGNGQKAKDVLNRQLDMVAGFLGFHPKNDLAASLGDTWCVYNSPGDGGLLVTGITVVGTLKDRQKILQANEKIIALYHQEMSRQNNPGTAVEDPSIDDFEYRGQKINFLNFHNINEGSPVAPAWAITADKIVVGLYPQTIKAYLDRQASMAAGAKPAAADGQSKQSLADLPEIAKLFAGGSAPRIITYQDTPNLFKLIYPVLQVGAEFGFAAAQQNGVDLNISVLPSAASILPHLTPNVCSIQSTAEGVRIDSHGSLSLGGGMLPVAAAMLLPATRSAQRRAGENVSMNNLKQIGLGLLNYEDLHHTLPAAYIADKDGKPLLSWRVMILPLIEENDLYLQFHLDEPWDSEHNKALIEKMPEAYKAPGSKKEVVDQGKTVYQTVRADSTAFTGDKAKKLASISDGTAMTIAAVETSDDKAVVWTKPDDFELNDKDPTGGLVGLRKGGFLALFLDAHVQKIPENADPNSVKALFTRAGGEPVNPNNLPIQARPPAANGQVIGGGQLVIQAAPAGRNEAVGQFQLNGVAVAPAAVGPAAERKRSLNNLKQIGLALHSFYSTQKRFPAAFVTNEGKPTLSWRVMILPYIENGGADLYKQFHLNEPWDSENNKKLIEKMPDVFKAPSSKAAKEFKTVYLTPRGEGTTFPGEKPVSFKQVPDGSTSKTIAVMETADDKAVIWTKPDDFDITQKDPITGLVGLRDGGFLTVFCDGSVHSIIKTIDAESLQRLFNRADGTNVDVEKFEQRADPKAMPPAAPAAAPAMPLIPAAAPAR